MIEAINVHKVYTDESDKELHVLKGVNFKLEVGRFAALVGPSGAGKSTLLHIMGGLDSPSQGSIVFEGDDLYKLTDPQLSRIRNSRIGFVFQFYHLLSEFNVLENVLMPVLISGANKAEIAAAREKALGLLDQVDLEERIAHFPNQLSGGEKQRVAIVRALMNGPKLLLCDEPTGNLDSGSSSEIIGLLKKINQERLMTILLVTHNEELAARTQKIYHLKDGIMV
ncbi:MAG: ABC transporter ATP-binding protein [Candidatus Omnitrophica bacterium]|nr:ABC transporter ATP-binding protein [Candidatus Omnitrophota bacterium]